MAYVTKDLELAERLQKEGCILVAMYNDPIDGKKKCEFKESVAEINKLLGSVKEEKPVAPPAKPKPEVKEEKKS